MTEPDDISLLREFAATESDAAFATLVQRYINLVFSTALRSVGNSHAAQEITQAVFIILARKAKSLGAKTILAGWLHQTTRLTAANFLRGEMRRQKREQEAYMQSALNEPEPNVWPQIAPLLDDAISRLGEKDRNAVVLRFFENKNLREVGVALGASEDAAKMRVNRALEQLRMIFTKRGVTFSAAAIAGAVSANSVQAAPAGLASTVAAASLAGAAGAGSIGFTATLTKTILMKKTSIIIALCVLAALITSFTVVKFKRARTANAPVTEKSLSQGLVLHLTFDSDETDGSITDSSGSGNNGHPSGVRWTPDGKRGGAYEFTKDGDEIVVQNNESLNPEYFTLSAWVKTTTGDHFWRRIFDKAYDKSFALSVAGDWKQNKSMARPA